MVKMNQESKVNYKSCAYFCLCCVFEMSKNLLTEQEKLDITQTEGLWVIDLLNVVNAKNLFVCSIKRLHIMSRHVQRCALAALFYLPNFMVSHPQGI